MHKIQYQFNYLFQSVNIPLVSFGLVWFNGMSTFVGNIMPNPSLQKDNNCSIYPLSGGIREFMPSCKGICPKVNVISFVWFSLFHGISTFVGYLMPKSPLYKIVVVLFNPHLGDKGVHSFPEGISPKVNVIERLEFELVYFKAAIQHFNHNTILLSLVSLF